MKQVSPIKRMTKQRQVILEEVRRNADHPTVDEVYLRVRERIPRISLATVYRNLETLAQCGLARKLHVAGGQARFDGELHEHYHVRCRSCGRIDDIAAECVSPVSWPGYWEGEFEITGYSLEFEGICSACRHHE